MSMSFVGELYRCPLCDGWTPQAGCDVCQGIHCALCLDAYGCEDCE